jgi:hypothetical protein
MEEVVWHLTKEQYDAIVAKLKGKGNYRVRVTCVPKDVESLSFGKHLCQALEKAEWQPIGPEESEANRGLTGVFLAVGDYNNPGKGGFYLRQALRAAGLMDKQEIDFRRASDAMQVGLCLQVGRKP